VHPQRDGVVIVGYFGDHRTEDRRALSPVEDDRGDAEAAGALAQLPVLGGDAVRRRRVVELGSGTAPHRAQRPRGLHRPRRILQRLTTPVEPPTQLGVEAADGARTVRVVHGDRGPKTAFGAGMGARQLLRFGTGVLQLEGEQPTVELDHAQLLEAAGPPGTSGSHPFDRCVRATPVGARSIFWSRGRQWRYVNRRG
jgi:hypothetical protein